MSNRTSGYVTGSCVLNSTRSRRFCLPRLVSCQAESRRGSRVRFGARSPGVVRPPLAGLGLVAFFDGVSGNVLRVGAHAVAPDQLEAHKF